MQKVSFLAVIISVLYISTLSAGNQANNLHRYMWANYNQFGGNVPQAQQWYQETFDSGGSIYTNKGYIHMLHDAHRYGEIAQLIPKLDTAFANDPEIQLIFALTLKKTGKSAQADDRLIRLNRKFKHDPEIIFHVVDTYVRRKEPENAIKAIDDYLNNAPKRANNFVFYYLKAQIYMQLKKHDEALKNVNESLKVHPHFSQGWLLFALMQEQAGKINEAIKGYTTYLEMSPGANQQIEQHLLQLVLKQKSQQQNKNVLLFNKSCFEKALILFQRKQYSQALTQIDHCLVQKPADTDSRLLKIQILTAMKKINDAITALSTWANQEPDNDMWFKTMHVLARAGVPTVVTQALETIHTNHPKHLLPTLYLADLHTRANHTEQALAYHKKALEQTNDAHLKTKIYFQMGVLYYDQQNYTAMKDVLEKGNALQTDFPPLLNLLAYYYATKGKQIDKAEKLLAPVLKKDGSNPHFLDTQAVILYKQKNYNKAQALLEKLVQQVPSDGMIQIHLAKTHCKHGDTKQAQAILGKAQGIAKVGYEQRVVEKLQARLKQ